MIHIMKSLMKAVAVCAAMCGFAEVGSAAEWVRSTAGGWNVIVEQVEERDAIFAAELLHAGALLVPACSGSDLEDHLFGQGRRPEERQQVNRKI